jgi:adenylate kinase family enzyme
MSQIGRRIVVYGPTGSGKTTVARNIAQSIGVPHIELDAIFWMPEWEEKSLEQFRADVSAVLDENLDGWVCDGNYSRVRDVILPMADTVVWLRLPFRVVFWQLLKRTITRSWTGELLWGYNRESWRKSFLSRESLFLYLIRNWRRYTRKITKDLKEMPHQASIIELHSVNEIEKFLASLKPTADNVS